jgi:hypothetical protein
LGRELFGDQRSVTSAIYVVNRKKADGLARAGRGVCRLAGHPHLVFRPPFHYICECTRRGDMKSTDIDRIDREFKRARKKEELIEKRLEGRAERSVGDYIKKLYSLFYHDDKKIYNLKDNADILTLLAEMKEDLPENKWDNVLRKAIKETKIDVKQRESAFKELKNYLAMAE